MPSKKTLEHYLRQMRLIEEHREKWCEENIRRHYRNLMTDLQEFLGVQYAQLAVDDKLTFEILHDKATYARFLEEVEQRIDKFSPQAAQEIRNTVQLTYQRAYEGMIDAVEKAGNIQELHNKFEGLRAVRPEIIKNAIKNKYMETALEKNHKETIYDIRKQIAIGLSQGDRMSTMANRLSDQVSKHYNKAMCIARTEVHRVREAGYQDSSERLSEVLKDNDSDYVMTKTWKTMKDMSVRPYRRKGKKGHKSFVKGKGPNHVKMEGVTVLVDEEFDLGDGVKAKAPGQSGVAGHDINCRCYLSRDLMTKAEFEKLTGRKLTKTEVDNKENIQDDIENKILSNYVDKLNPEPEYEERVQYWKEQIKAGNHRPILVSDQDYLRVIDGNHTLQAYKELGVKPKIYAVNRIDFLNGAAEMGDDLKWIEKAIKEGKAKPITVSMLKTDDRLKDIFDNIDNITKTINKIEKESLWTGDDIDKAKARIKKNIVKNGQLTETQRMEFDLDIVDNWSDEQVLVYDKFTKSKLKRNDYHAKDTGYYSPALDAVFMDIDDGYRNKCLGISKTANWQTKFHEEFHQIDHTLFGKASGSAKITNGVRTKEFKQEFEQDILELMGGISKKKIKNLNALIKDDDAMLELIKYMKDNYRTAKDKAQITMFTDALGLATKNKFSPHDNGFWGHRKDYNKSRGMQGAASETWATFGGISMSSYTDSIEATKKLMPRTYKLMEKWFKEIVLPKCT